MLSEEDHLGDGDENETYLVPSTGPPVQAGGPGRTCVRKRRIVVSVILAGLALTGVVLGLVFYLNLGEPSTTRTYSFQIKQTKKKVGDRKYMVKTINGKMPAPAIHVKQWDTLSVNVTNRLANSGVTIHWHGLNMRGYQVYDGVAGVTQCPIPPGTSYLYQFKVEDLPGTHLYHTHNILSDVTPSGLDFVRGPLIVHGTDAVIIPECTSQDCYQMGNERILFYQDLYPNYLGSGVLNGEETHEIKVENGEHKFRIINGGDKFAFFFSIDGYKLTVAATDGHNVEPYETDLILIHSGERYDVLVNFNITLPTENVWIRAMERDNENDGTLGVLRIRIDDSIPYNKEIPPNKHQVVEMDAANILNCMYPERPELNCKLLTDLVPTQQQRLLGSVEYHTVDFMEGNSGEWFVSIDGGKYTQNLVPHIPVIMSAAKDKLNSHTPILSLPTNRSVTLVLRNRSFLSHPMHLHGHHFEVLEIVTRKTVGCQDDLCPLLDINTDLSEPIEQLMRRSRQGVLKDTVILPAGGAVVLRLNTNSPGVWFLHCHVSTHLRNGMGLVLNEGGYLFSQNKFPQDYPQCDSSGLQSTTCNCTDYRSGLEVRCSRAWLCGADGG